MTAFSPQTFLTNQGWDGPGSGLRKGSIKKPVTVAHKTNLKGIGKERDTGYAWWDDVFSMVANKKKGTDVATRKTSTGIHSPLPPGSLSAVSSAPTSGVVTPVASTSTSHFHQDIIGQAKLEAARKEFYAKFLRGRPLEGTVKEIEENVVVIQEEEVHVRSEEEGGSTSKEQKRKEKELRKAEKEERRRLKKEKKDKKEKRKAEKIIIDGEAARSGSSESADSVSVAVDEEANAVVGSNTGKVKKRKRSVQDEEAAAADTGDSAADLSKAERRAARAARKSKSKKNDERAVLLETEPANAVDVTVIASPASDVDESGPGGDSKAARKARKEEKKRRKLVQA